MAICATCRDSGLPGWVFSWLVRDGYRWPVMLPCPDCQGNCREHCCEGLRAQPEPPDARS